jgi:hypothetical protein
MNTNLQLYRSAKASPASINGFQGDALRQIGNMRAATLNSSIPNTDHIFGMARAVQESIDDTFGQHRTTSNG